MKNPAWYFSISLLDLAGGSAMSLQERFWPLGVRHLYRSAAPHLDPGLRRQCVWIVDHAEAIEHEARWGCERKPAAPLHARTLQRPASPEGYGSGHVYDWLRSAVARFDGTGSGLTEVRSSHVIDAGENTTREANQLLAVGRIRRAMCAALDKNE